MQATTLYNQVFIDMAMQCCGDVEALFAVAEMNGLSITTELVAGSVINFNTPAIGKQPFADVFIQLADRPASNDNILFAESGIGKMQIGRNFKVS